MKTIILWSFGLLFPAALLAEGIALDEQGRLLAPHEIVLLNESQKEEVEALDSVTLTKSQWKKLRVKSPNTPKRLKGILPITWNDCTCGTPYEGILLDANRLAVFVENQSSEALAHRLSQHQALVLRVDHRGQFYFSGALVRYPTLLEAIAQSEGPANAAQTSEGDFSTTASHASIETPPLMNPTSPVFAARIVEAGRLLESKGWKVWAPALEETRNAFVVAP